MELRQHTPHDLTFRLTEPLTSVVHVVQEAHQILLPFAPSLQDVQQHAGVAHAHLFLNDRRVITDLLTNEFLRLLHRRSVSRLAPTAPHLVPNGSLFQGGLPYEDCGFRKTSNRRRSIRSSRWLRRWFRDEKTERGPHVFRRDVELVVHVQDFIIVVREHRAPQIRSIRKETHELDVLALQRRRRIVRRQRRVVFRNLFETPPFSDGFSSEVEVIGEQEGAGYSVRNRVPKMQLTTTNAIVRPMTIVMLLAIINRMKGFERFEGFDEVYKKELWTNVEGQRSGPGSTLANSQDCVEFIVRIIDTFGVRFFVDISCGDMHWQPRILERRPDVRFLGVDVSPTVIRDNQTKYPHLDFVCLDATDDWSKASGFPFDECADLIMCRHTLMHLLRRPAQKLVENMVRSARLMCLTSHADVRENPRDSDRVLISDGKEGAYRWKRVNMARHPFLLSDAAILDRCRDGGVKDEMVLYASRTLCARKGACTDAGDLNTCNPV